MVRFLVLLFTGFLFIHAEQLPLSHPIYDLLTPLQTRNLLPRLNGLPKPYDAADVIQALQALDTLSLTPLDRLRQEEAKTSLHQRMTAVKSQRLLIAVDEALEGGSDADGHYLTRHALAGYFTYGRFSLVNRVAVDLTSEKWRYDHLRRRFKKTLFADMPEAYASYTGEHFGLLMGRNRVKWGPGHTGSLMLGDHQSGLTQMAGYARFGFLQGFTLSAKLDSIGAWNRYFSAAKLVIQLHSTLTLALNQSIVYAGPARNFELFYVLPSFIYYFGQFGFIPKNATDNVFVGADMEWKPLIGLRVYFEFLADDFQVDRDSISASVQNGIAYLLGAESQDILFNGLNLGAEFVHINSYVYKHVGGLATSYVTNLHGGTLGHAIGPDAEMVEIRLSKRLYMHAKAGMTYRLTRRGDLNDPLGEWNAYDKRKEATPHGRVENCHDFLLTGETTYWKGLTVGAEAGYRFVQSPDNQPGQKKEGIISGRLTYYFDRLLQWDDKATLFPL
ncbi:MAG: hypothetical protein A2293_10810 [Elusimicrobia bacterium RIFOXYB2_FULL_49_7]|nr:MAG: hypothetical protein A2293_10810 [Elusimicrobia bacterium RIFOXYB2_FULL_49_7]